MIIHFLFTLWFSLTTTTATNLSVSVPYGTLCLGILGNIYEFPGGNCTSSYKKAKCYCKNIEFSKSVVSCIGKYVANITSSQQNEVKTAAYNTVSKTCKTLNKTVLRSYESEAGHLPLYYGGSSGRKPGKWPVTSAFSLTDKELVDALNAYKVPLKQSNTDTYYGSALLGYWAGIFAIKAFTYWFDELFPRISKIIGNCKIGRTYRKHLQIYCWRISLITLTRVIIVAGFVVISTVLTFCNLPVYNPNYSYLYSSMGNYGVILGVRAGIFAIFLIPLFFLFAGRNNILQFITGWTQENFLVFHRWVARVEVVLLLVHTISYSLSRGALGIYTKSWKAKYWKWGVVALVFGCFIFVQSMKFIRRARYELFLVSHITAAVLFIIGGYYHIKFIKLLKLKEDLYFFYASFAVWGFDRVARIARLLYAGVHNCKISLVDKHLLVIVLDKPKWWPCTVSPGAYVFVHFLTPTKVWQSHPLTITTCCNDNTKLKLYFRVYKGISQTLAEEIKLFESYKEMRIMLDGPYGVSYPLHQFDECVFIAGGSGITVPLAYIQNISLNSPGQKPTKITLHWTISDRAALSWFKDELKFLSEKAEALVFVYTGKRNDHLGSVSALDPQDSIEPTTVKKNIKESYYADSQSDVGTVVHNSERLDVNGVLDNAIVKAQSSVAVMCCGPASLHISTRTAVFNSMDKTRHYVQYYEESYSW